MYNAYEIIFQDTVAACLEGKGYSIREIHIEPTRTAINSNDFYFICTGAETLDPPPGFSKGLTDKTGSALFRKDIANDPALRNIDLLHTLAECDEWARGIA